MVVLTTLIAAEHPNRWSARARHKFPGAAGARVAAVRTPAQTGRARWS